MLEVNSNPVFTDEQIKEARVELWNMGILYWKLDITQRKIYDFFKESRDKTIVINASRRLGKSYALLVLAIEQCLQKPKSIVKFLQPEVKMIRTNIHPIIDEITIDCPPELMPEFRTQDNIYYFKNGSQLQLAGTDNGNYMKLRGGNSDLCLIDEAGFCTELKHIINYVLIPTTTLTKGRIILSSTTPPNPDHEFITYMESAEKNGTFIRKTINDAVEDNKGQPDPRITQGTIDDIVKSLEADGGAQSDSFRTEYLCEIIFNSDDAVLPEFTQEVQQDCVVEWRRPVFADNYAAMDIGFTDGTAILLAYYDYDNAVVVIEDEIWLKGQQVTAQNVSEHVFKKEEQLWLNKSTGIIQTPYMRVSDNNPIFLNDLSVTYGCHFLPSDKQNKSSYINKLKTWIKERRVIINPRCKNLLAHMRGVTWDRSSRNKNGQLNDFKRNTIDKHHYDFVDALVYLVRNVDEFRSPYPKGYKYAHLGSSDNVFYKESYYENNADDKFQHFKQQFTPKTSFSKKSTKDEPVAQFFRKKDKK